MINTIVCNGFKFHPLVEKLLTCYCKLFAEEHFALCDYSYYFCIESGLSMYSKCILFLIVCYQVNKLFKSWIILSDSCMFK